MRLNKFCRMLLPLLMIICLHSKAQSDTDQQKHLKILIDSKKYGFIAQSATAKKGKTVQLSPGYGLVLNNDSLHVGLPYYGRAYTTSYPPSRDETGIQFNSHDFSYLADTTKKGGWDITIKPKGVNVSVIYLSISSTGYCTVRISSSDRDPISYYGTIAEYPGH